MSSSIVSGRDVTREKWLGGANRTSMCWSPAETNRPLRKRGSTRDRSSSLFGVIVRNNCLFTTVIPTVSRGLMQQQKVNVRLKKEKKDNVY